MKRQINKVFVACLVILITALAGCNSQNNSSQTKRVAFVTNNAADFWTIARRGCEAADKELADVSVEFKIPSDAGAEGQKRIIDDLLAKGVEGIAISPVDPANQIQLINDTAKKALVITQDSDAPTSERALYIGTDNLAAGRQAGELIKEALPNGGKIMIFVGKMDTQNAQERSQGIKDALQGSKVEIVDIRTDDTDPIRAKSNVADALVKTPDLACLVGLWSYNGPAIFNAVKDAGRIGQVKIVCFDEDDQTLAAVKEGGIYATVVQQPYEFGYRAIHLMSKILSGNKSDIPAGKQIFVPTLIIKRDNVEEFTTRLNQLRGRS